MSQYNYYIKKIYQPANDSVVLELKDKRGHPAFQFTPGQYVMIAYKNEKGKLERKHAFSLASSPTDSDAIRLGIRIGGRFTQGLSKLKEGAEVLVNGPFGKFVFDENKYRNLVFIAGGIGITPFLSAIRYASAKGLSNKLSLIYSNKTLAGTLFYEELKELSSINTNLDILFSLTEEKGGNIVADNILSGRVNGAVIKNFINETQGKTFFICGPKPFMEAMRANLYSIGVDPIQIQMEGFSMISGDTFVARLKNVVYAMGISSLMMASIFYFLNSSAEAAMKKKTALAMMLDGETGVDSINGVLAANGPQATTSVSNTTEGSNGNSTSSAETNKNVASGSPNAKPVSSISAPKPVTETSTAVTAPAVATPPKTAAKTAVVTKPAVSTAPKTVNTTAPSPVTATSITSHAPVTDTAVTQTQNAGTIPNTGNTAPAATVVPSPVTSSSVPASTATTGTSNPTAPVTPTTATATVTPVPTPATSASTVAAAPVTNTNVSSGTVSIPVSTSGRNRNNDDDDD